jgi:hypothetical protein
MTFQTAEHGKEQGRDSQATKGKGEGALASRRIPTDPQPDYPSTGWTAFGGKKLPISWGSPRPLFIHRVFD